MKKVFMLLTAIMILVASVTLTASAQEEVMKDNKREDSNKISDEIKRQLNIKSADNVFRIYNVDLRIAFSKSDNIDDVLAGPNMLEYYYAIQTNNEVVRLEKFYEGQLYEVNDENYSRIINQRALKAFRNDEIIKNVAPDIEVYGTYYLSGEVSRDGTAIYYKTNMGDYVCYSYYQLGGEYLFPVEDFCKYQKAILDEYAKHPGWCCGSDISNLWDLSKYDFNSASFDIKTPFISKTSDAGTGIKNGAEANETGLSVRIAIAVSICVLTAGIGLGAILLYRRKKGVYMS